MVAEAAKALRNAAGNYYVNDKSTGSVVAQQPFGGARASGRGPPLLRLVHGQREDHWEVKAVELNVECGSVTSTHGYCNQRGEVDWIWSVDSGTLELHMMV